MDPSENPPTRDDDHPGEPLDRYPRPSVAVDIAVLTVAPTARTRGGRGEGAEDEPSASDPAGRAGERLELAVLLLRRAAAPHAGRWGLPGSMVREREPLTQAVLRTLADKCGIDGLAPRQLQVLDDPRRDDRGWVISVAHVDVVPLDAIAAAVRSRDDLALAPIAVGPDDPSPTSAPVVPAASAGSAAPVDLPGDQADLPFDHDRIVVLAVEELRRRYREAPDPAGLVAEPFTLLELRRVHEAVLGRELQKDTFRRQVLPHLEEVEDLSRGTLGRPARRFRRTPRE